MATQGKGLSFIKKIFLLSSFVAALLLVSGGFAGTVHPEKFWLLSFLGLAFPLLLAVNVFFVFFWMVVRLRYSLIPIAAVCFAWFPIVHGFAINNPLKEKTNGDLKVMTWNVRNFDLYNWNHNKETREKMFELIKEEQPDVACFQEFYSSDAGDFQNEKLLVNECGFKYHYFYKAETLRGTDHWGVAVFSKLPIVDTGKIDFGNQNSNVAIYTDVIYKKDTLRVFTTHLQSVYFGNNDYHYLDNLQDSGNVTLKGSGSIFRKLKPAFITRAQQADTLKAVMEKCKHPYLLCGDFNDTPSGYAYHTLSKNMQDAFLKNGFGTGATYAGNIPLLRIDYILLDSHFMANSFYILDESLSDHYAAVSTVSLK